MFSPANILVATDLSKESDRAITAALDIAGKYKAHVELLYVLDDVRQCSVDYCIPQNEVDSTKSRMLKNARRMLKEQIERLPKHPKVDIRETVKFGNQLTEILTEVEKRKIDLLVAAPHEKHKAWHAFSHLTNELAEKSECETLLVHH